MRDAVLITRPEPGAAETAGRVAALGWQPVLAPALVLESRPPARLPAVQAVLLPSRAAARALFPAGEGGAAPGAAAWDRAPSPGAAPVPDRPVPTADGSAPDSGLPRGGAGRAAAARPPRGQGAEAGETPPRVGCAGWLRALPVLAVGEATAAEARARGAQDVTAAEGDAIALATLATARLDPAAGPLLLAVGQGYGAELAAALRGRGFRVIRRVVYAAAPAAMLPEAARAALAAGRIGASLFFSPRSATIACGLIAGAGLAEAARGAVALALSPRIAEALTPLPWQAVRVAPRPDQAQLLALLGPAPRGTIPARTC